MTFGGTLKGVMDYIHTEDAQIIFMRDWSPVGIQGIYTKGTVLTGALTKLWGRAVNFKTSDGQMLGSPIKLAYVEQDPDSPWIKHSTIWRELTPLEQLAHAAK